MPAQKLPPQQEERDVEEDDQSAHRGPGQGGVDDLGQTGDASEGNAVGHEAPVEGHGVQE